MNKNVIFLSLLLIQSISCNGIESKKPNTSTKLHEMPTIHTNDYIRKKNIEIVRKNNKIKTELDKFNFEVLNVIDHSLLKDLNLTYDQKKQILNKVHKLILQDELIVLSNTITKDEDLTSDEIFLYEDSLSDFLNSIVIKISKPIISEILDRLFFTDSEDLPVFFKIYKDPQKEKEIKLNQLLKEIKSLLSSKSSSFGIKSSQYFPEKSSEDLYYPEETTKKNLKGINIDSSNDKKLLIIIEKINKDLDELIEEKEFFLNPNSSSSVSSLRGESKSGTESEGSEELVSNSPEKRPFITSKQRRRKIFNDLKAEIDKEEYGVLFYLKTFGIDLFGSEEVSDAESDSLEEELRREKEYEEQLKKKFKRLKNFYLEVIKAKKTNTTPKKYFIPNLALLADLTQNSPFLGNLYNEFISLLPSYANNSESPETTPETASDTTPSTEEIPPLKP